MKSFRKGQGTLEYVIILAAVIGAIILVATIVKAKLGDTGGAYDSLTTTMKNKVTGVTF